MKHFVLKLSQVPKYPFESFVCLIAPGNIRHNFKAP